MADFIDEKSDKVEDSGLLQYHQQHVFFKSSEKMEEIPSNSIDVIVTSPPYNRGKTYSSDQNHQYNDHQSESDYLSFLIRVWKECFRVTSQRGVFFLNIGDSASDQGLSEKVAISAEKAGWIRIQDIIWVKSIYGRGHYTPSGGNKRFNNVWEHVYLFVKNKLLYMLDPKAIGIPYADKSNIGRYGDTDLRDPGNVWHICYEKTTGNTIKKGHDAPFPIGLPYQCIQAVPNAETVLDPFLGTGTTLAAAQNLGKVGYGYESFPRKEIILQTLRLGKNFLPSPPILIPHYEQSINTLVHILTKSSECIKKPTTKKGILEYTLLLDTLEKMGHSSSLTEHLKQMLEN